MGHLENLELLRQAAEGCEDCALSARRTKVVFGEGNPASPLLLVGEGPGENEDKTGRPFVGRAGQLLDKGLADCGLSREDVYISNTVKCRACDWNANTVTNRAPTPEETAACRRWLLPQIAAIQPMVILCIGAPSAKNLIKNPFRITIERGKLFRTEYARCIMATLHPAYILRQNSKTHDGGYSLMVSDIQKAWDTAVQLRERAQREIASPNSGEAEVQLTFEL